MVTVEHPWVRDRADRPGGRGSDLLTAIVRVWVKLHPDPEGFEAVSGFLLTVHSRRLGVA